MSEDDAPEGFYEMTPNEAGDAMKEDPASVLFPLLSFMAQFNLEKNELWPELQAGRIAACGVPTADGYSQVVISAKALFDWLGHPDTPPHLIEKVATAMSGRAKADT